MKWDNKAKLPPYTVTAFLVMVAILFTLAYCAGMA